MRLDRVVVGGEDREAAVGDPPQQRRVPPVEHRARAVQHLGVGVPAHLDELLREAGVQQHHVARLDDDAVGLHHAHQLLVADDRARVAKVRVQVDHHAAPLDAVARHVLHAERARAGRGLRPAARRHAGVLGIGRPEDVEAAAEAVVEHRLGQAVAVGVEHRADVREAVPLRRVLQVQHGQVVADHVAVPRVVVGQPVDHVGAAVAHRRPEHRRMTARVQRVAARQVERQRQAEGQPLADLGHALPHLLRPDQVQSPELVVGAEVAPVRTLRTAHPARGVGSVVGRHRSSFGAAGRSNHRECDASPSVTPTHR